VELVPVEGRVTLDGQPPPAPGTIFFAPAESFGDQPLRPAQATFDQTGYFLATAFSDADGLIPGRYRVHMHCWEIEPTVDGPPAKSFVPMRYTSPGTSGLELVVESAAESMQWDIPLTRNPR
jgi:hypothetical protein